MRKGEAKIGDRVTVRRNITAWDGLILAGTYTVVHVHDSGEVGVRVQFVEPKLMDGHRVVEWRKPKMELVYLTPRELVKGEER